MNYSLLKRAMFLLSVVLFILSFISCSTTGGAVGVEWGQETGNGHHHKVKKAKKGRPPPHAPANGYRKNITIGIILPVAFTMTVIENYIFTLKGLTGGYPHHCLMLYN